MAEHEARNPQDGAARDEDIKKVADLIHGIDFAMLTTVAEDGNLHSRPMSTQKMEFDGTVWFFTYAESGKAHEVESDPRVNVSYAAPNKQDYVSLTGTGAIVRDRAKMEELWQPSHQAWFPQGLETPGIALLRVDVDRAEIWDAPSGAVAYAVAFVKAKLTGRSPDMGENKVIEFAGR